MLRLPNDKMKHAAGHDNPVNLGGYSVPVDEDPTHDQDAFLRQYAERSLGFED